MVMPAEQTCPTCGQRFMGSDCLGDSCLQCKFPDLSPIFESEYVFWSCPDHPLGEVEWEKLAGEHGIQDRATCKECGKTCLKTRLGRT